MASPPNAADIKASFPELVSAGDPLITAKLAEAITQVDYSVYTPAAAGDMAVRYLTAHLLALSPFGNSARLANKDGSSTYETMYLRLQRQAACGIGRVA